MFSQTENTQQIPATTAEIPTCSSVLKDINFAMGSPAQDSFALQLSSAFCLTDLKAFQQVTITLQPCATCRAIPKNLGATVFFNDQNLENLQNGVATEFTAFKFVQSATLSVKTNIVHDLGNNLFAPDNIFYSIKTSLQQSTSFQVTLISQPEVVHHYVTYFTWLDLVAGVGGIALILYFVLSLLVPTDFILKNTLLRQTQSAVQTHSNLMPKFHMMNDSVGEMLTVAKDMIHHRQRAPTGNCC